MGAQVKLGREMDWSPMELHRGLFHKTLLSGDEAKDLGLHVWRILKEKIAVGGEIYPHTHDLVEVIHITDGEVSVLFDGERVKAGGGDTFIVPIGMPHGVINTGSSPSYQVSFFVPPRDQDDFGITRLVTG